MFDTYITIIGNVLSAPEWRRTRNTGALVANFRIASTSRRYDRASGKWVDGDSLRVRVNCWRRLAEGVAASIMVGDPVVVVGRMYSRDWKTDNNERRVTYELEAVAVGHDLAKGRAKFERKKGSTLTTVIEDEEAAARVGGEPSDAVDELNATRLAEVGDDGFDEEFGAEFGDDFGAYPALTDAEFEALSVLRGAGLEAGVEPALATTPVIEPEEIESEDAAGEEVESVDEVADGRARRRRRERQPVPA